MASNSFWVIAPFDTDQVKSFNTFQRDERWDTILCVCGGRVHATESGIICPDCYKETDSIPSFSANWTFNNFKGKE